MGNVLIQYGFFECIVLHITMSSPVSLMCGTDNLYCTVPIPPGTGFSLFPFPVSPLKPTISTNCERGTRQI